MRNAGGATSPAIPLRFYLTTGTEPGSGDVLLGTRMIGALAINGASAAATSLVIPVSVNPGDYRILAVVDPDDAVAERNESNNFRVSSPMPVTLYRPDLTLTALKVPAAAQSGRPLAITHTVHNAGPAPASASVMTFFIVSDATADSVLLGTRKLGALSGHGTSTLTTSLPIPASLPVPAAYHVMTVLDSAQQLTELDESNNMLTSSSIAVTAYRPDLTVTDLVLPAKAQAGRPLAITHTVSNIGPAPARVFVIRFYLSTDDRLDTNDVLLGARSLAGRAAGASAAAITTVTVPAGTVVPASYRVIAVADALEQQVELDESNNVMVSDPLPFIAYRPEILITALGSPAVVQAGRPMVISHTVRNAGPAAAGPFVIRFFLSADDTPDAGDLLLGTRAVGGPRRRPQQRGGHERDGPRHCRDGHVSDRGGGRCGGSASRARRDQRRGAVVTAHRLALNRLRRQAGGRRTLRLHRCARCIIRPGFRGWRFPLLRTSGRVRLGGTFTCSSAGIPGRTTL